LSVNVFSTKVYELRTLFFTSLTGDGTALLRGHSSHVKVYRFAGQRRYLHFSVILRPGLSIGVAPGIEPVAFHSAVKHSTNWANPGVVSQCHSVTCTAGFSRSRHPLTSGDHPLNLIKKMQIKDQSILNNLHWLNYWRQKLRGNVDWGDLSHQHLR